MTVILMHPTDELFFTNLQKELTECLFTKDRILFQNIPLWIELGEMDLTEKNKIKKVQIGALEICKNSVVCPVTVDLTNTQITSKLTLISLHKGIDFTAKEASELKEKPVRQLKVFRLGIVADQGPHAKSISKSVWCKIS